MIIATVALACCVMALLARKLGQWWQACIAAMLLIVLFQPDIWSQMRSGFASDSFWTLDWVGRLGVVAISGVGIGGFFAVLWRFTHYHPPLTRVAMTLIGGGAAFAILHGVAPQVFYSFYLIIFPELPQQWVIDGLIDWDRFAAVIFQSAAPSLANYLSAAVFWSLWPWAVWQYRRS